MTQFLEERGMDVFLPMHQSWRQWSDRKKLLLLPLFPSYVFVRIDREQRSRAVQAPGFLWFVHNERGPVAVASSDLRNIRALMTSGLAYDPMPSVQLGDEVEIVNGVMRGCRGNLLRKDYCSVVLTVHAIQGAVRVCLPDPSWIVPVPRPHRHASGTETESAASATGAVSRRR